VEARGGVLREGARACRARRVRGRVGLSRHSGCAAPLREPLTASILPLGLIISATWDARHRRSDARGQPGSHPPWGVHRDVALREIGAGVPGSPRIATKSA